MTRNLKALGLALVAMLALGAVAAAGASAQQGVLTSDGPVTLDITETGGAGANGLKAFGSVVEAEGSTYTGHKWEATPHELLNASGEKTATITPHYNQKKCTSTLLGVKRPCTITTNGCDFVFHIGETTETANTYGVTADVECPDGQAIDLHVYKFGTVPSEHNDIPNKLFCTITVPEQTGLTGPHLTVNTTEGDIGIQGTFTKIKVTKHGGASCGAEETKENGEFIIDATITGTDDEGNPTDIAITDE